MGSVAWYSDGKACWDFDDGSGLTTVVEDGGGNDFSSDFIPVIFFRVFR